MGAIDCLHSMNLFHIGATNPYFEWFDKLKSMNVEYLRDSNLMSPAYYALDSNNMKGMKILFDMVPGVDLAMGNDHKMPKIPLDKSLLFHGLAK